MQQKSLKIEIFIDYVDCQNLEIFFFNIQWLNF